jgi:hypothetical protein
MQDIRGIVRISEEEIVRFLNTEHDNYAQYDDAILNLIKAFPDNSSFRSVILKATVINKLYATNIHDVYSLAKTILDCDFDARARQGDLGLVNDIATMKYGNNKNRNYSFATKYCNWHFPERYPIFDNEVRKYIKSQNKLFKFSEIKKDEYRDYVSWKRIIDDFIAYADAKNLNYKQIDKYLWLTGRKIRQSANTSSTISARK